MLYHFFESRKDSPLPVHRHYGVRTKRYKLIYFYGEHNHWELFDLKNDPNEMSNIYNLNKYPELIKELKVELIRLRELYSDTAGPAVQ